MVGGLTVVTPRTHPSGFRRILFDLCNLVSSLPASRLGAGRAIRTRGKGDRGLPERETDERLGRHSPWSESRLDITSGKNTAISA